MILLALSDNFRGGLGGKVHLNKPAVLIRTGHGDGKEVGLERIDSPVLTVGPPAFRLGLEGSEFEAVSIPTKLRKLHRHIRDGQRVSQKLRTRLKEAFSRRERVILQVDQALPSVSDVPDQRS